LVALSAQKFCEKLDYIVVIIDEEKVGHYP